MVRLMGDLSEMLIEELKKEWPAVKCAVFPSVPEDTACGHMEMGGRLATALYVADANMQQRCFKLVVSEGSEGLVRSPITLSRLLEEKAEVMVSSMICKPQMMKGVSQLGVVTVAQVVIW